MATSGNVTSWKSTHSTGTGAYFDWVWSSTQTDKGKTKVSWSLYGKGRTSSPNNLKNSCVVDMVYNGTTTNLYTIDWGENQDLDAGTNTCFNASKSNALRKSGSFTINHASDGSATFQIKMTVAIWDSSVVKTTTTSVTLDNNKPSYTVSYNANGGSGAPAAQTKTPGTALTLSTTVPTYTGRTFQGWGTSASDTTVDYAAGASYTTDADITLYAIWKLNTYKVQYNANGFTVSSGMPATQTKTYGTALTLSSSTPIISNATVTGYKVTFNANGGSCSTSSLTSNRTRQSTFSHWNTAANNSGTTYNKGASYTANTGTTLYLQATSTYTNGSITLPTPTRSGHTFLGWATSSTATSGVTGAYTPTSAVTLYAIWEKNIQGLVHIDSGTAWKAYTVWIDNGTTWKQYVPYIDTGTEWKMCGE